MAAANSVDVTLVPVDTSILSCWEEKVKQGIECSLLLKHSKGKVITTLKCSVGWPIPNAGSNCHLTPSTQAKEKGGTKKKKNNNKGGKKRKLESLLASHQRLVEEKGFLRADSCWSKLLKNYFHLLQRSLRSLRS